MAARRLHRDVDLDYMVQENSGSSNNVPAFLMKLWTLVEDSSNNDIICWDVKGKSFHIFDQSRFAHEVLPFYFKHNNISSFIRQLNMYGFRKVVKVEQGGLKVEHDDLEFQHAYFQRGQEQLLDLIKRRSAPLKEGRAVYMNPDDVIKVQNDVEQIKGKQDSITNNIDQLKKENEALWREVVVLRQKHAKQQQIVNKLLQFLLSLVNSHGRGMHGLARKRPLMIDNPPQHSDTPAVSPAKMANICLGDVIDHGYTVESPASEIQSSPSVPPVSSVVIHELEPLEPSLAHNIATVPQCVGDLSFGNNTTSDLSSKGLQVSLATSPASASSPTSSVGSFLNTSDNLNLLDQALMFSNLLTPQPQSLRVTVPVPAPTQSHTVTLPVPATKQSHTVNLPVPAPAQSQTVTLPIPAPNQSQTVTVPFPGPKQSQTVTVPVSAPKQSQTVIVPVPKQSQSPIVPSSIQPQTATQSRSMLTVPGNAQTQVKTEQQDEMFKQIALLGSSDKPLSATATTYQPTPIEMTEQIAMLQSDLDKLREALSSGQYSLDPSFLAGLFEPQSSFPVSVDQNFLDSLTVDSEPANQVSSVAAVLPAEGNITGQELWQYQPPELFPDLFPDFDAEKLDDDDDLPVYFDRDNKNNSLNTPAPIDSNHSIIAEDLD